MEIKIQVNAESYANLERMAKEQGVEVGPLMADLAWLGIRQVRRVPVYTTFGLQWGLWDMSRPGC